MSRVEVVGFYDRHPINEAQILASLEKSGRKPGALTAEDLFEFDQDHYGGVEAVEARASRAGSGRRVWCSISAPDSAARRAIYGGLNPR